MFKVCWIEKTLNTFFLSDLHKGAHQFEINLFQCCLQIEDVKHFVILMCVCFEQLELRDGFFFEQLELRDVFFQGNMFTLLK